MLTYELKKSPGVPLYEALYRCIRGDILSGVLKAGEKLPSKRALAENLEVSKITVETAYSQLLSEGYIRSQEKVGYFVEQVARTAVAAPAVQQEGREEARPWLVDLTGSGTGHFPFSVWSKLQREVMLDYGEALLLPLPNRGIPQLRQAIAEHLAAFRGMHVDPENILIGAGTDFLYNLLIQLLGRDKVYAVEEPGYGKIRKIYAAGGVACGSAAMDSRGVIPESLQNADVLHCSPSHHFPTGLVTPVSRRMELLAWARERGGWIIEDDYDSEFRFDSHPKPAMQSLDSGRVIYMNSFSKSLAPSIRISYMVLPRELMADFQRRLGFYSCTVPSFEQYTLARFLSRGYFEKHINRMRKSYKSKRNAVVSILENWELSRKLTILEQDAGLHFLVKVDTALTDAELEALLVRAGIRVRSLASYYHTAAGEDLRCFVVNYAACREEDLETALNALSEILKKA
ncbi:MAG: PLP-dependent aminotransferase family protein [Oscillospiraceae bacterium]|nr:PLP-dependent aminotransferase family protein [Oscillospiraceae bacterium]